ncbi:MAG: rod shape-determining protein MreD [Candidatus Aureabacteria bacterium]|nr:rod shape-determining protein MreD [Candidatus Auribacterota bacterium]
MRAILAVFILVVVATVQSASGTFLVRFHIGVDLLLLSVISCALLSGGTVALMIAAGAGLLQDALGSGAFGIGAAVDLSIAFLITLLRRRLWVSHWTTQSGLALLATLCAGALYALAASVRGGGAPWGPGALAARACANAVLAPPVYRIWHAVLR